MTSNMTLKKRHASISIKVATLRTLANLAGTFGAFFILCTAGSSDAGRLSITEIVLRLFSGAVLLLAWRVIAFYANELERKSRKPR